MNDHCTPTGPGPTRRLRDVAFVGVMLIGALTPAAARAAEIKVWCIDDMAKIDPVTGKAFEENPKLYPKGLRGDYSARNTVWDAKRGSVRLLAARNEVVAFQIVLRPDGPVKGVTLEPTDLTGEAGRIGAKNVTMFRQWYIHVTKSTVKHALGDGWYPDPLIPLRLGTERFGGPLDIPDPRNKIDRQTNQAVWVDLYVPGNTKPGLYKGAIRIGGPATQTVPVELEVLDVTIPNAFHYMMCLNNYGTANRRPEPMRIKYYQLFQRHRIYLSNDNGRVTPKIDKKSGRIDWTDYDRRQAPLLDGSAFTAKHGYGPGPMQGTPLVMLQLPFNCRIKRYGGRRHASQNWPDTFRMGDKAYEKLFKDTVKAFDRHWVQKGWTRTVPVLYTDGADEPTRHKEYEQIRYIGMLIQQAKKELGSDRIRFKTDIGNFANVASRVREFKSLEAMMQYLDPAIDFWCCNGGTFPSGVPLYDVDAISRRVARGKLAFYYGTNLPPEQGGSYVDSESVGARVWALIAARYELTGGEIWHFMVGEKTLWEGGPNSVAKGGKKRNYGYAQHVYPEKGMGVDFGEPIASIRLKGFRRGQQDAEYIWLARNRGLRKLAEKTVRRLIPDALDKVKKLPRNHVGLWPHDPAQFAKAREQLARALAADSGP